MKTLAAYGRGLIPAIGVTLIWWAMDYLMGGWNNYWVIFIVSFSAAGWANMISDASVELVEG